MICSKKNCGIYKYFSKSSRLRMDPSTEQLEPLWSV